MSNNEQESSRRGLAAAVRSSSLSRRDFLFGAGVVAAAGAMFMVTGCSSASSSSSAASSSAAAVDDGYPTKEIRVLVPYAAGGNTDLNAREVGTLIEQNELLPYSFVVSNLTGQNTMEAVNGVADAEADGYTLLCHHTAWLGINASGAGNTLYTDLDPVIELATAPFVIVASKDSGFTSVDEVVDYANAHEGELKIGYIGTGSTTHLAAMEFLEKAGIADKVTPVSYESGADALNAQLSGEIQLRSSVGPDAARYITSGDLIGLTVSGEAEADVWEGIPSWSDLGWDVDFYMSQGLWTTKGTPQAHVDKLVDAITQTNQTDDYADFCAQNGMSPKWTTGSEWQAKLDSLYETCKEAFDSGILE